MKLRKPCSVINNEKGMVLVVAIMLVAVLVLLGTTSIMISNTDLKISGNYRSGTQAFYIADAGLEVARNQLRTNLDNSITINQMLAARVGANGVLSDSNKSTIFTNIYANGTFLTDDVPLIAETSFGGGTYRVYMTNDGTDGVTTLTDTNNKVTLTSIGRGPANSLAILQEVVQKLTLPPLPGAVVLPGPNVVFNGANSNASGIAGMTESAISTTSAAAETTVQNELTSIGRIDNYTCDAGTGVACINNEPGEFGPWGTVAGVEDLAATYRSNADSDLTGPVTLTAAQVGTTANRKIVFVDGDATLGPVNGAGILIVTGQLTLNGNFNYNGLIMVIGKGNLQRNGGGNGDINGSIYVAKTRDNAGALLSALGIPTFDTSGGGNSDIRYDSSQLANVGGTRFLRKSWQRI